MSEGGKAVIRVDVTEVDIVEFVVSEKTVERGAEDNGDKKHTQNLLYERGSCPI
jgi:hypothetical protein